MDNLDNLKTIAKVFNEDKIITADEIETVLAAIITILSNFKKDTESLNSETQSMLEDVLNKIAYAHEQSKSEVASAINDSKSEIEEYSAKLKDKIRQVDELYNELKSFTPLDGIDGKDADEEAIIEAVIAKIPKTEEFKLTGEMIVDAINALTLEDENKIDAKHIKNIPNQFWGGNLAASTGGGSGTGDVVGPSSSTDNALARFDSTTGKIIQNSAATLDDSGILSTASIIVSGTNGAGHINLRHQASDASATGQSTALFADANGDLKYKNDGDFYTTFVTSSNTANRTYTFLDASYTVAGVAAALTSSRIPYADSNGFLTDTADLNWVNSTKTLTIAGTSTASSGIFTSLNIQATANQSGTAGYKALIVNVTETATGSGSRYLADYQIGGATRAYITNKGTMGFSNGIEVGYDPGGASASQNAIRNVGGISFAASTGGYGADNFHFDGTNMYYDCGNGMMFFRPQGGGNYALYLNNNSSGLEYKDGSGTTIFQVTSAGTVTTKNLVLTANATTAVANAATIPVTSGRNIVTNNSAATLTLTLTTAGAVNMQTCMVQILDFSAAAQTITWVNTENSTVTAPTTSNGSTTLPLTVGFVYNSATSKWRCVSSA